MAHKVVLRVAKLKSFGNVAASLSHTYRTRETPNAEPTLANQNTHSHSNPQEVMQALKDRLPDKRRSDAVLGLEYVVTAHQDWFKALDRAGQDAYLMDSLQWLRERHGAENVVGWSIHRDEMAPHLAVYVVPLKDGKLNAKHFTGGKKVLSQLQTDFARDVGQRHGLERGIEGSQATHTTVKEHYAAISKATPQPVITAQSVEPRLIEKAGILDKLKGKGDLVESSEGVADRLTDAMHRAYAPATEKAKRTDLEARRAAELARTAQTLANEKKRLLGALEDARARNAELRSRYEVMEQLGEADPKALEEVHAQAKQRLGMARISKEFKRRVADLPRLAKDGAGAARTFAAKALTAMGSSWRTRGGRGVDWKQVDEATFYEHISSPVDAYDALIKHSPRAAEPAIRSSYEAARDKAQQEEQRRLAAQLQEEQRRLAAQLPEEPQRPQEVARPRPAASRAPRPR